MKFLVFGGRGWIGGQVLQVLADAGHSFVVATSRADIEADVEKELQSVKPDRVVCLIGRTRGEGIHTIDYLEQKGKLQENMKDNLWGPVVLSHLCAKHGIHCCYLGTGCIFHYDDEVHTMTNCCGFTEGDDANFTGSAYSTVKGFTDRIMRLMFNESCLNCRIRMPITPDNSPYNFITKIVNYERVINIPNSMTVLPELLPILIDMCVNKVVGTVNLTNPGAISHNEVLSLYKKHVDSTFEWKNFTTDVSFVM
jgi:3,5-epimerase/4-reductase